MLSTLTPQSIAVLAQTSLTIGLFDYYRIVQSDDSVVTWIKPTQNPLAAWVRPRTLISLNTRTEPNRSETVHLITSPVLRFAVDGTIDSSYISNAVLHRLNYNVSFYENDREYSLYTVTPDYFLPWCFTFHTSNTLLHIQQRPTTHFRLQNVPVTPAYMAFVGGSALELPVLRDHTALKDDDVCPITLEVLTKETVYWTPCGHGFSIAIQRALDEDPRCPLCRAICYFSECEKDT